MPWNWGARPKQSVQVGGSVGTTYEADNTTTWPNYDAAYLAKRLGAKNATESYKNRYDPKNKLKFPDTAARAVYLDKVAGDFRSEADECLKQEFQDWLEGRHDANVTPTPYPNNAGQMKRRAVFNGAVAPGEAITGWNPTPWGQKQLTHLDGVREFLREKKVRAEEHEFAMNVLAEFGPNNIDQAWTYFKHWVKGRPVGPEECLHNSQDLGRTERSGAVHMAEDKSSGTATATVTESNGYETDMGLPTGEAQMPAAVAATVAAAAAPLPAAAAAPIQQLVPAVADAIAAAAANPVAAVAGAVGMEQEQWYTTAFQPPQQQQQQWFVQSGGPAQAQPEPQPEAWQQDQLDEARRLVNAQRQAHDAQTQSRKANRDGAERAAAAESIAATEEKMQSVLLPLTEAGEKYLTNTVDTSLEAQRWQATHDAAEAADTAVVAYAKASAAVENARGRRDRKEDRKEKGQKEGRDLTWTEKGVAIAADNRISALKEEKKATRHEANMQIRHMRDVQALAQDAQRHSRKANRDGAERDAVAESIAATEERMQSVLSVAEQKAQSAVVQTLTRVSDVSKTARKQHRIQMNLQRALAKQQNVVFSQPAASAAIPVQHGPPTVEYEFSDPGDSFSDSDL